MNDIMFYLNNILLGIGLAMDAFSVSLANGLNEPDMNKKKMCGVAGIFGIFQGMMPFIGWICVHTLITYFTAFEKYIPWIALILLLYIGGKMLYDGIKQKENNELVKLSFTGLIIQGIATSIDALSVGFTIPEYTLPMAIVAVMIIAFVTFIICMIGLFLGKKIGTKLANKATIFGGIILILIGIEIFVMSFID